MTVRNAAHVVIAARPYGRDGRTYSVHFEGEMRT